MSGACGLIIVIGLHPLDGKVEECLLLCKFEGTSNLLKFTELKKCNVVPESKKKTNVHMLGFGGFHSTKCLTTDGN